MKRILATSGFILGLWLLLVSAVLRTGGPADLLNLGLAFFSAVFLSRPKL